MQPNFPQNSMKMKKIGPRVGAHPQFYHVEPPLTEIDVPSGEKSASDSSQNPSDHDKTKCPPYFQVSHQLLTGQMQYRIQNFQVYFSLFSKKKP